MPVVKWAEKVVSRAKAGGMTLPKTELSAGGSIEPDGKK